MKFKARKTFHAGNADKSARLKKLADFLRKRRTATTMQIDRGCDTTRASSDISELRSNGWDIEANYVGKVNDRKIYQFVVISEPKK